MIQCGCGKRRRGRRLGQQCVDTRFLVYSAAMSEDGRRAISASRRETLVWDLEMGKQLSDPIHDWAHPIGVTINADGTRALSGMPGDRALKAWNLEDGA